MSDTLSTSDVLGAQLAIIIKELKAENARLRAEVERLRPPQVTLVACTNCNRGVRHRDTFGGRCPACEVGRLNAENGRLTSEVSFLSGRRSRGHMVLVPADRVKGGGGVESERYSDADPAAETGEVL